MNTRELWLALEQDQIEVHLQSEVWLEDGRHFGFEALPRLRHPNGLIAAEDFLPHAERTSLALPLARRLVERACQELEGRDRARPDALVSIAPTGLGEPSIGETVAGALAATGTSPGRLCLAVSSRLPAAELEAARDAWGELRQLGVRFALDHCGAGVSSEDETMPLEALAVFPFDYVRVDSSLIRAVSRSSRARRLIATIARAATELEAIPVADGIQTNTEAIAAYEMGCQVAQGPRFGSPLPPRFAPNGNGASERPAAVPLHAAPAQA